MGPLPPLLPVPHLQTLSPLPPPLLHREGEAPIVYHPGTYSPSRAKHILSHWGPTRQGDGTGTNSFWYITWRGNTEWEPGQVAILVHTQQAYTRAPIAPCFGQRLFPIFLLLGITMSVRCYYCVPAFHLSVLGWWSLMTKIVHWPVPSSHKVSNKHNCWL